MSDWKKYLHIGRGGRNCSCCFPAPGSLDRRKQYRKAKREAEAEAIRIGMEELYDASPTATNSTLSTPPDSRSQP